MNATNLLMSVFVLMGITGHSYADSTCSESRKGKLSGGNIFTVVNKEAGNQLSPGYSPADLMPIPVSFLSPFVDQRQSLRAEALAAFAQMHKDAAKEGISLFIRSAYRSFDNQCVTFASKVEKFTTQFHDKEKGLNYARKISAEPGRSQHQLGTTVDIVFKELNYDFSIKEADKTISFRWLDSRAQDYGFILSFPFADDDLENYGYNSKTGYFYEPWHWRYIGIEKAREFKKLKFLPDEYLKSQFNGISK